MRALVLLVIPLAACGRRAGDTVIDAPVDAVVIPDAAPDAAPDAMPPHCAAVPGTTVAAPVWAAITGEAIYVTAPANDPRVFVLDRLGTITILDRDGKNPRLFLDLRGVVDTSFVERGLLGLAFAPDFASSHRFYVDFNRKDPDKLKQGDLIIAELQVSAANPDAADLSSRRDVMLIDHHRFANHNGGTITFGPDGYLYISVGDGGGSGGVDFGPNAQDPTVPLGKILRIDPRASGTAAYTVPADNPFVAVAGDRPEIWHLGLRNPYRFSFDRGTGAMFIADVGASHVEEVDVQPAGQGGINYGWQMMEGNVPFSCSTTPGCDPSQFTAPIAFHTHKDGWCAVMGGAVYRGTCFPDLVGRYFYTDYCRTDLWWFDAPTGQAAVTPAIAATGLTTSMTSVSSDGFGELYVTNQNGEIRRIGVVTQ